MPDIEESTTNPGWDQAKAQALRLALAGVAFGGGASMFKELMRRINRLQAGSAFMGAPDNTVKLTLPNTRSRYKRAADEAKASDAAAIAPAKTTPAVPVPQSSVGHFLESSPWALPMLLGGGSLGAYGGYKGMEWVMSQLRERENKQELASAQAEFERALQSSHLKRGSFDPDTLYDEFEKCADWADWIKSKVRWRGMPSLASPSVAAGGALAGGGLIWLLTHMMAKNYFGSKDPERAKIEALKKLRQLRNAQRLAPIPFEMPGEELAELEAEGATPPPFTQPPLSKDGGWLDDIKGQGMKAYQKVTGTNPNTMIRDKLQAGVQNLDSSKLVDSIVNQSQPAASTFDEGVAGGVSTGIGQHMQQNPSSTWQNFSSPVAPAIMSSLLGYQKGGMSGAMEGGAQGFQGAGGFGALMGGMK